MSQGHLKFNLSKSKFTPLPNGSCPRVTYLVTNHSHPVIQVRKLKITCFTYLPTKWWPSPSLDMLPSNCLETVYLWSFMSSHTGLHYHSLSPGQLRWFVNRLPPVHSYTEPENNPNANVTSLKDTFSGFPLLLKARILENAEHNLASTYFFSLTHQYPPGTFCESTTLDFFTFLNAAYSFLWQDRCS